MLRSLHAALCVMLLMAASARSDDPKSGPVFEMRTYVCEPGKLDALNARFREHTLRIFEKHGMKNVAYWTPIEGEGAENTLIYILSHESREAAKASWAAFRADPEWQQIAADSQAKHGKILARPPEAVYMTYTDYSPNSGNTDPAVPARRYRTADPDKVYELRIYTAADGKLDALHARFREHTTAIFHKHGMGSYAYWQPQDEPLSRNVMLYVLEHESREAATLSWNAFRSDPEWQRVVQETEKDGKLLAQRPEAIFMKSTDYSPRR